MNTPTPTPRTEAAWSATFDGQQMSAGRTARALRECSQQLETELAALTAERDQLRAEVKSCGELSCDECNARTAALTTERDQLRAELARLDAEKPWLKEANATIAQLHAEVERLRSDRDCEKRLRKDADEFRENAIARAERAEVKCDQLRAEVERLKKSCEFADFQRQQARAERAEAEVSKLTDALDMMREEFMRIIACPGCNAEIEDLANRAQLKLIQRVPVITQRDRAEAELAAERARLDWLESDAGVDWQWSDAARTVSRASIDVFMKEDAK